MSNIIKNAAILALISSSADAHRINQRSNVGVRFIATPQPDDSMDVMISTPTGKSAQDKLFDQMEKDDEDQSFFHNLEQTKASQNENMH